MTKRVLVAMSGGVDSSAAAAILKKQDWVVEGVTMKLAAGLCCDIGSAQEVCRQLNIPHRMIDAQAEFSQGIVGNFIAEYRKGRTPNPCIKCNELIKFNLLLGYARSNGFDHLATGHYARIEKSAPSSRYLLKRGSDEDKDQSYFLYRMTQDQMKSVLFPVGGMQKGEVRALAREMRLSAAERPESQEICFVPDDDYRSFLRENAPETLGPGELALTDGTIVGKHGGIAFFTVGQRRRLGVAVGERLYVVRIEPETNRVVLGRLSELETREMTVSDMNYISFPELHSALRVQVKVRYRSAFVPATIEPSGIAVRVVFEEAVKGVCPGQAAVFYDGETVIGGGTIE
ncbi:MAG TPA: tRNA 2-thiouridine(34) synthase MnmA [Nitrospirota bacterium]|nr:tRNA 2-thiouridine(34) synthase MnmA [Nitrospirota bacterium]